MNTNKLIELADILDKKGLKQEADLVDGILKNAGHEVAELEGYKLVSDFVQKYGDKGIDLLNKLIQKAKEALILPSPLPPSPPSPSLPLPTASVGIGTSVPSVTP